ncbi:hypothetical protein BSPWISOXPB_3744 [uncultured Gammaproteobacteria bacterium]|nr:hypothetical protein BSPWISOXPB_3744 [uncultured Gammaproteobacteria bacterium]
MVKFNEIRQKMGKIGFKYTDVLLLRNIKGVFA